ncbi:alcohol dehydrogenase catalytic domain-containing protein [Martelella lutilitoris]|uniref:Alcohol dehydrogenase catalytic domain-containing protein n=1 Tax=Martelella lutilitoris TaxID=2583532 RepID=A0A7T7HJ59_9HYPH|nr:zinc-binding dehydrogenase [Martelella lutilitoris]QQM30088.1 alcohol dehydrogenase catalytic domain-containing protein [Martelella lutilitoris]
MNAMMRAAVYHALDDIRLEDRPVPVIGPGEVLLKTLACGLCGGETMAWYKKAQPKVLGHEPVGEVVKVGEGVTDYKPGDRLFVNHHVGRVNSHWSLRGHFTRDPFYSSMKLDPGGVCEYYRVTAQHLAMDAHKLPDSISNEAATTIEPWSCVLSGLKVCNIQPGDTVAVVGAGFMGQGFVHMAPLFGAGKVVSLDFSEWRLEKARFFGATHTINPKTADAVAEMRALNNGRLADTVIVIAPFPSAWDQAMALVEPGGCLHLGAPLPPGTDWVQDGHKAYFDQITVTSRYSSDHRDTYSYIRLLEAGRIRADDAISHRFGIEDSAEAFRMLVEAEKSLKIVVYPHGIPGKEAA